MNGRGFSLWYTGIWMNKCKMYHVISDIFPGISSKSKQLLASAIDGIRIRLKEIADRKKMHDPNNTRDFVDCYFKEMNEQAESNPHSTFSGA